MEVRAREGHIERRVEEEEYCLAHSFHSTLLSGKLWQLVCWSTNLEERGVGVSSPRGCLQKDQEIGVRCLMGETPLHAFTPHGKTHMRGL